VNHRSKNVSEKIKGGFSPLSPPGSAYVFVYRDRGCQPHTFALFFFSEMNGFMFSKSKGNPKIIFNNPIQARKPNVI